MPPTKSIGVDHLAVKSVAGQTFHLPFGREFHPRPGLGIFVGYTRPSANDASPSWEKTRRQGEGEMRTNIDLTVRTNLLSSCLLVSRSPCLCRHSSSASAART